MVDRVMVPVLRVLLVARRLLWLVVGLCCRRPPCPYGCRRLRRAWLLLGRLLFWLLAFCGNGLALLPCRSLVAWLLVR